MEHSGSSKDHAVESSQTSTTYNSESLWDKDADNWNADLDDILGIGSPKPSSDEPAVAKDITDSKSKKGAVLPLRTMRSFDPKRTKPPPPRGVKRSVSFSKVQVREFQQILVDNPCQGGGPSIGLGWQYNEQKETAVDKYEYKKASSSSSPFKKRPSNSPVRTLSPKQREEKARNWGYSKAEIDKNCKKNKKVLKQRQETLLMAERTNFDAVAYEKMTKAHRKLLAC